jgi:hypothetical protein
VRLLNINDSGKKDMNPLTYLQSYLNARAKNGGTALTYVSRFLPWKATNKEPC